MTVPTSASKQLETFPNPTPGRDYEISFECPEFTCLCPRTGQPDFATIRIRYVPDRLCVELKSLKLYLWSFRDEGHFHEAVTNRILDDLVQATRPRRMTVVGDFYVRGGIHTTVTASYEGPRGRKRAESREPRAASRERQQRRNAKRQAPSTDRRRARGRR
jgi:7-cyano-7-deazaguanine reductase